MTRIFQKSVYLTVFISFFTHSLFSQTNPLSPASGFDLFLEGNFTITQGDIEGAIAVGGNMTVLGNAQRTSANATGGISYVNLSGANYALIVNGSLIGTNGFNFKIDPKAGGSTTNHFARFGTISPSTVAASSGGIDIGNPPTDPTKRYVRINSTSQTASSVQNSTALVNFATAFSSLRSTSASLAACTGNVTPSVSGGQATLNLGANSPNVWNIAGATLNTYSQINLTGNLPSALKPLIINVSGSGTFNWSNVKFVMGTESDNFMEINRAPYIIWNFKDVTNLNIQNSNLILGSILAPNADLKNNGSGNITGQVIAKSFTKPQAGELHIAKFNTTVNSCGSTCTNPTVSITGTSDICSGSSTTLTASVSSGSGYTYLWNTGATTSSISVAPTTHTSYSVTVTVTGGCSSSANKQVNVNEAQWDDVTVSSTCNKLLVDANFAATGNFVVSYTYGGQTYTEPSTGSFSSASAFELTGQGPGIYSNITIKRASSPVCTAVWPQSMTLYPSCDVFSCPGNLIVNPSFENGTTGWNSSGGNFTAANYAAVFGVNSGHFKITNGSSNWVSQQLPGTYTGGSKIDLSTYAGTHNPSGFYHSVGFDYFDTNGNWKGSQQVEVNSQLPTMTQYVLTGTVQSTNGNTPPANNTYRVSVRANGTGDWIKTDGWCAVPQVTSCNVSISGDDNVCVGDSVILTATSSSGTPVSYSWSNGGTSSTKRVGPTTNTTYTVTATFSNGCTATASKTITVSNPPSITQCEVRVNNAWSILSNCIAAVNVGDDVALSINPNTFPAGYTQEWEGPNGFTATGNDAFISSSITAAHEGNYTVIISNGICTISQNIFISVNQTDDCSCLSGNLVTNGSFTNNFTGWSGTSYDASGITSCSDGINKAFISNEDGSEAVLFQEITSGVTANTKFTYSFMAGTHSPSGTHKARVKFYNSSGGFLGTPLNLEIDKDVDFPSNSWCLNLQSYGPYEFTTPDNTAKIRLEFAEVTTKGGYIKVANVDLKKCNSAPVLNLVATNPLCNGQKGSVSFTTSGGSGTKTVRLNGNVVTSPVNNLNAGTYVFTVTDATSCSSTKSVTITQPTAITATTTKVDVTCAAPNSGSINLTVSGGTPTYTFSWSNGATTEDLSNLTAGTYTVTVTDANGCTASSSAIITAPTKYTIGDLVWLDLNGDGVQNGGTEVGVSAVTVTLYKASNNAQVGQTTTNGSGIYSFEVCPDTYYIIFGTKSGYNRTISTGAVTNTTNSDASVVDGKTSNFTVTSSNITYVDAGLTQIASLGDKVWLDLDADGVQDGNETTGINGVTVNLYADANTDGTPDGASIATTTTSGNGDYSFTNLVPGNYIVEFIKPSGYTLSPQNNTVGDDPTDSDANATTGRTGTINLVSGENDPTNDAGLYQVASLGDKVWLDLDADGIQDGNETTGVNGVTVKLYADNNTDGTPDGASIAMTTTSGNGDYSFTNLVPGNYIVEFTKPVGYTSSPQTNTVGNDPTDSDANTTTGRTGTINLVSGENDPTNDAGLYQAASLGDKVWLDLDADGIQDGNETTGVNGVTVKLYADNNTDGTPDGASIAMTTTSGNGDYSFTNLVPGNYIVEFTKPAGYTSSPQTNTVGDDPADSDANTTTGRTGTINLVNGENDTTNDAGLYQVASLGDKVWLDLDADGIQDGNETTGVNGVTVKLYADNNTDGTPDGTSIAMTTTSGNGDYSFTNLVPGNYIVEFTKPVGYTSSPQTNTVGNDPTDSDANTTTGRTGTINLVSGENDPTNDAGLYQFASIGDYVWYDGNKNGIQDSIYDPNDNSLVGPELPVKNAKITLYNGVTNAVITTTITNSVGYYAFTNLTPGSYYVGIDMSTIPGSFKLTKADQGSNDARDSDADTLTFKTIPTLLTANEFDQTWDFGVYKNPVPMIGDPCSCHDIVYDANEPIEVLDRLLVDGAPGEVWRIIQQTGMQIIDTFVNIDVPLGTILEEDPTDPGHYEFNFAHDVAIGYSVTVTNGTDILTYNNVCFLPLLENNTPLDVCLYDPITPLTGRVVLNGNDVTDGTIKFYKVDGFENYGTTGNPIYTEITVFDPSLYTPGTTVDIIVEYTPNTPTQCPITQWFPVQVSLDGSCLASIGDTVWFDGNANGLQETSEAGLAGVQVTLLDGITMNPVATDGYGNAISPITTGTNGKYLFSNLKPGSYKVQFGTASGYARTTANAGNDAKDSDASTTNGTTGSYVLAQGAMNMTVDAGYKCQDTIRASSLLCANSTFDLNSVITAPNLGGTWFNSSNQVVNNVGAVGEGVYKYVLSVNSNCNYVRIQTVTRNTPDYTPIITLLPSTIQGISNVNVLIDIVELNDRDACSPIYAIIPVFDTRFSFTYSQSNGSIGGQPVNNNNWQYLGIFNNFHYWTFVGNSNIFPASGVSTFGFTGVYNPYGTDGVTSYTVRVVQGSGGEVKVDNNSDGEVLNYNR